MQKVSISLLCSVHYIKYSFFPFQSTCTDNECFTDGLPGPANATGKVNHKLFLTQINLCFSFFRRGRRSKWGFHDDGDGLDGDGDDDVLHAAQQLEGGTPGQATG